MVPSKGGAYLKYLIPALGRQSVRPDEVVLVLKDCDADRVESLCGSCGLSSIIVEQREGYVTRAYDLGRRHAEGDLVIFTDDDAIPPRHWVEKHLQCHRIYGGSGCISSRDIIWAIGRGAVEAPRRLPRWLRLPKRFKWHKWARLLLAPPHPILKKYRFGLYLTKRLDVARGPYVPDRSCYSMPYKGVNMSFKREALEPVSFPEHPMIKRGFGFEQHISLQLILNGVDCVYVPDNPVFHIDRESLSRSNDLAIQRELKEEFEIMRSMYADLIGKLS